MQRSGLPESCEFAGQVEGREGPAALVLGLVLDDDDLGSRVLGQFGRKVRGGQRVVLLQTQDRGLLVAALLPLGLQVVDDLPAAMSTRVTSPEVASLRSGRTGRKPPTVKSAGALAAAFRRSIDFGVKTMSGRRGRARA